jgi:sugar transferase (PEP-CTERM system associated)
MSRKVFLLIIESIFIYLCGVAAVYLQFAGDSPQVLVNEHGWLKLLLPMVVVQGSYYLFDLYEFSLIRMQSLLVLRIFQALGLSAITLSLIVHFVPQMWIGRNVFLVHLFLMLTAMSWWRLLVMWLLRNPRLAERVLIVGTGKHAVELAREVLKRREGGLQVIGFLGDDPRLLGQSLINPRVIGMVSQLKEVVQSFHPERIVIAVGNQRGSLPMESLLELKLRGEVAVEESSSFYERLTSRISTEELRPSQLIFANSSRWTCLYRRSRQVADIAFAFLGLLLSSPVMLLTAIAIKLESPGPILYTQDRTGLRNQVFKIIKFRSMRLDAEADGAKWAEERDPRATRIGRIIRKLRIDELPQFINVIRGDMSFIGPRPERPIFVKQLERDVPYYSQRHLVKPGLTGWAQVRYPYGASAKAAVEKLQYDLYYIKNQSLMLDIIILFETARIVLFGKLAR